MGYRVGISGVGKSKRQALLQDAYSRELPKINSREYMAAWGKPNTATRLKTIACSLAEFTKSHKKNDSNMYAVAIRDWQTDLTHLRATFYEGKYSFVARRLKAT